MTKLGNTVPVHRERRLGEVRVADAQGGAAEEKEEGEGRTDALGQEDWNVRQAGSVLGEKWRL